MNSATSTRQQIARQQPRQRGLFIVILELCLAFIGSIFISLVLGTIIEWAGMNLWWKNEGVNHSRDMVEEDLGYLKEYRRSLVVDDSVQFASYLANGVTHVAEKVGLISLIQKSRDPIPPKATTSQKTFQRMLIDAGPYLLAAVFVCQDAMIRLAIVWLALPAFMLALALGFVDGLVRRDIRKWSGGRESSFVYHHAKRMLVPAFTGGFLLYMTWPTGGFNPAWMVLPFCAVTAWTVSLMAATFKKYL